MKKDRIGLILLFLAVAGPAGAGFDDDFTGLTLRVDYHHTGTADVEHFALRRILVEGPWPGSRTQTIDTTNQGKYLVEVVDQESNRVLYTRGFASIFGEWETTGEAREGTWRAIQEALRVPEPQRPFQLRLRKRATDQSFREIWDLTVDPASRFVDRPTLPVADVVELMIHGEPALKADLVILGDGYAAEQMDAFAADARRAADALFAVEPFRSRRSDFNVRAIKTPANESGISRPRAGVFRTTPLGARYNSFDSERYILSLEDHAWRDVAAAVPYDFVLILVKERKYGGGGIFNLYSTAAMDSAFADYLVVHEFGHHFAGLGDEYFTSPVAYEEFSGSRVEPWEPNITALGEEAHLKWGDLVAEDTPLPTPWDKDGYEAKSRERQKVRAELRKQGAAEEQLEELFREEQKFFTKMLGNQKYSGKVGAFEGAMYEPQGLYRPTTDCIMFTRDDVGFCPVCERSIIRIINLHTR